MIGRWVKGALLLFVVAAAACQLIAGIDDRKVATGTDSGQPDVVVVPDGGPDPCSEQGLPPRPAANSLPTDSVLLILALKEVHLGLDAGPGKEFGVNLDKTCTCPAPDTCKRPPDAGPACDLPKGVDNAGREMFRRANAINLVTEAQLNQTIAAGYSGAFIQVDRYNGKQDDSQVRVSVFSSLGIPGWDAGAFPKFDGNDQWLVDKAGVLAVGDAGQLESLAVDETAYVAGGTLVANLDQLPITIGSTAQSPVIIDLTSGVIVGPLTKDGSGLYHLNGMIAGRWSASKLLASFHFFIDPLSSNHLCQGNLTYELLKENLCTLVDIARAPTNDNTNAPCDAIGFGLGFEAMTAKYGLVQNNPDGGFPCGTAIDSCSN